MSVNDTFRASSPQPSEEFTNGEAKITSAEQLAQLTSLIPPTSGPVIAVDLDDVLSQTNVVVSRWHNDTYQTEMDTSNFYYYYYWKNPFWGSPMTTHAKVREFYVSGNIHTAEPVPGAREGIQALRDMGYRLVIVTARGKDVQAHSWEWVQKWFTDCFDSMICTGQFANSGKKDTVPGAREVVTRLSKAEVCIDIGAKILVDDSLENALACANYVPQSDDINSTPPRVLLFGSYEWNHRYSEAADEHEDMVFEKRSELEGGQGFLEVDTRHAKDALERVNREKTRVTRVKDWSEVVRWISNEKKEGRM
ncbi:hypothetical protein BJ138DRAFT_1109953 [Hygrophoropsis aurantiaca]|uniref:Uncharacterized protein n=1 Tax=Hygrophoropsis aurantiaca TaxID=72124 RepID=A0ACB8AQT1_9AGAM|nr:hypothetical protein BJ138DRAFT_1109953 [Hygrophoropsis aurantiaca]